ncbi:MAG: glycosyltransferase family 1 protein [Termitinemataceae bacterium]|nr:MAG: glycosyltransferase family 1 protein [Termitinemataceae bacterium]
MQKTVLINGYFLCRSFTGIERYASEITKRLDNLCRQNEIAIIIPGNSKNIPSYKNIKIILYKKKIQHIAWQMFTLQFFLLRHRQYTILEFGNTALPFAPGIVFLHDIYCEFFKEDFSSFRDKLVRLYSKAQYRLIAKKAKQICTVSNYSKNQIAETYHISPDKIKVIYSSWDHFKTVVPDNSIFENYPSLLKNSFYFSLGSLSKRKNIKWIIEYAAKNKDTVFAITGSELPTVKIKELNALPKNIILLGYLDDGKVKALMHSCKAFILPSYYEGFGLTPLEALSCGAQIIIANAASLPEIYGNTAHYIDPFDTNINLDDLLKEPVEKPDGILEKYSYNDSSAKVYNLIKEFL